MPLGQGQDNWVKILHSLRKYLSSEFVPGCSVSKIDYKNL